MEIYRCYIVYNGSWLVFAPLCILWIAGIGEIASIETFGLHRSLT